MPSSISLIPPGTGGVTDYAVALADGIGAPVMVLTATTDVSALSGDYVYLHFSGYGFHHRGVPLWLVDKVRSLRPRFKAIGVIFHELYAFGPPWRSAFWLSRIQRRIALDLLELADFWSTSRDAAKQWLCDHSQSKPHRVLPVFSTIGESSEAAVERSAKLVVFGSDGVRSQVYRWAGGEIFRWCSRNAVEIHDVGSPVQDGALAAQLEHEQVVRHGRLPAQQVRAVMLGARYGALVYKSDAASKSSVFAAFSCHGLCPVLLSDMYSPHDGLIANINFAPGFAALDHAGFDAEAVGRAARSWYQPHRLEAHVQAQKALAAQTQRTATMAGIHA